MEIGEGKELKGLKKLFEEDSREIFSRTQNQFWGEGRIQCDFRTGSESDVSELTQTKLLQHRENTERNKCVQIFIF